MTPFIYKPSKTSDPIKIKIINNIIPVKTDEKNIANHFNAHYVNVGQRASNSSASHPSQLRNQYSVISASLSFYLKPVTEEEIVKIINSMRGESGCGHDGIQIGGFGDFEEDLEILMLDKIYVPNSEETWFFFFLDCIS